MNKCIFIGRITKDIDYSTTANKTEYARFSIAVNRAYKDENGERQADFINCIAWKKTAELIYTYAHKGDRVGIVGTLQNSSYEANDGTRRYTTDIVVNDFELLEPKKDTNNQGGATSQAKPKQPNLPQKNANKGIQERITTADLVATDEDLPF